MFWFLGFGIVVMIVQRRVIAAVCVKLENIVQPRMIWISGYRLFGIERKKERVAITAPEELIPREEFAAFEEEEAREEERIPVDCGGDLESWMWMVEFDSGMNSD